MTFRPLSRDEALKATRMTRAELRQHGMARRLLAVGCYAPTGELVAVAVCTSEDGEAAEGTIVHEDGERGRRAAHRLGQRVDSSLRLMGWDPPIPTCRPTGALSRSPD